MSRAEPAGSSPVPAWYASARADVPARGTVEVHGAPIRYRSWGTPVPGRSGLVLVHGASASGVWWEHLAPLLAGDRHVVALDVSGHGDSGRRPAYTLRVWAEEILAVGQAVAPGSRAVLVAHSMGGAGALYAASEFGDRVSGLVLIDPMPHDVTSAETHARTAGKFGRQRAYPTRAQAAARFKVLPDQPTLDFVLAHLAHHAVRETAEGWTWKHDPSIYQVEPGGPWDPTRLDLPLVVLHPEFGLSDKTNQAILGHRLPVTRSVVIPAAAHHVLLDEPLALITCLRTLLSGPPLADRAETPG